MLIDAHTLPNQEVIETEVCIVGAGPAGITLAREWIGRGFRVCLLESGGLEVDPDTQALCQGKIISNDHYPKDELEAGRRRQFGGASNRWHIELGDRTGVRHTPLDEIDFTERDWLPYSGWAIGWSDLEPYYHRAQDICQIGPFAYDADTWADQKARAFPLKGDRLTTTVFQFGPRDIFAQDYREEIEKADNITAYLHANVVEIETNELANLVTRLKVACLDGKSFWVTAKIFILAMGGFENARLLLSSNQVQKSGLGNQHDLVGRFYMDHPGFRIGELIPAKPSIFHSAALYDLRYVKNVPIAGKFSLTEAVMQREHILNTSIWLFPRPKGHNAKAIHSLKTLLSSARQGKLPKAAAAHVGEVFGGIDDILHVAYRSITKKQPILVDASCGGWSSYADSDRKYAFFEVAAQVEQAPHPDNRITLSDEHDALGLPKVQLHWKWSDIDLYSLRRTQAILQEEFAGAGLGHYEPDPEEHMLSKLYSAHHHMGTTRMHNNPQQGIVDANGQVHGISNLFIMGSSIFPTGGYANPTLTIVALSVRLAEHVTTLFASP